MILFALSLLLTGAQASPPIPEHLFHWTTHRSLAWMAEQNPNPGLVPMQTIPSEPWVVRGRPGLIGRQGTFAWSNPVTSVAGSVFPDGTQEMYGRFGREGQPPRLLVMKPAKDARVLELTTKTEQATYPLADLDFARYDLVYHTAYHPDGRWKYHEWIVLDPRKIEAFTADPEFIRPLIEPYLSRLRDPGRAFARGELHASSVQPHPFLGHVEAFLAGGKEGIPPELLGPLAPRAPRPPLAREPVLDLLRRSRSAIEAWLGD
ncbi:MAG: hypothetical protein HY554_13685 [Elusimicrobia bacterium]|nr:hypothetical protein [Elusimicrobiota bacterium]